MQDVSYEPLMLCPSENPQASLDIFSQPHHLPGGQSHHKYPTSALVPGGHYYE